MRFDLRPPGGNVTWLAAIWIVLGAAAVCAHAPRLPQSTVSVALGLIVAVTGVGLWFRMKWSRWTGFPLAALLLLLRVLSLRQDAGTINLFRLVINLWYFWALWEWGVRKEEDKRHYPEDGEQDDKSDMVSLVMLLREPRYLDAEILSTLASKAWGQNVTSGESNSQTFIVGESPMFVASCDGMVFTINNFDWPYVDDAEEAAVSNRNMRVSEPLVNHRAWLSVDVVTGADNPEVATRAYGYIGMLIAELYDENCLAILRPATGRVYPVEPELESKLRAADPLAALDKGGLVPIIRVRDDDPRMQAAIAEARRRWPEFIAAWESRADGQPFSVKAAISDGEHTEYMWLMVTAIENDIVYGRVDNEPLSVRGVQLGDTRSVRAADIWDWNFIENGQLKGAFSLAVLREVSAESDE